MRKRIIEREESAVDSWAEAFAIQAVREAAQPALEPMPVPCVDCAVVTGLYAEVAQALGEQPREVKTAVSERWWCHNNCHRACRGNWDINVPGTKEAEG